jgi:hypothetical protein
MEKAIHMQLDLKSTLAAVRNDRIEFMTMRPPGSQFSALDRRVVVTGPPELVQLAGSGDVRVLEELVELLQDPNRAWAAMVILATMTRREEKAVDSFAAEPNDWWNSLGKTAYQRWTQWLNESKDKLLWDSQERVFIERK